MMRKFIIRWSHLDRHTLEF